MENTSAIIGYILFAVSEILPLLPIPTSGILHTFIIGTGNAFKAPRKDIELAIQTVQDKEFAQIINALKSNPRLKKTVMNMIRDPTEVIVPDPTFPSQTDILNSPAMEIIRSRKSLFNSITEPLVDNLQLLSINPKLSSILKRMETMTAEDLVNTCNVIEELILRIGGQ